MNYPKIIAAIFLLLFVGLGLHNTTTNKNHVQLQEIQLKATSAKLKSLQLKYDVLNKNLDNELKSGDQNQQKIKDLEKQKSDLQQQLNQAQKDLQAKANAKNATVTLNKAAQSVLSTGTAYAATCDAHSIMAAAGVSETYFGAVNYIISHEGGWCGATTWNTAGSGAYGICQSLPASKMASAGTDYMTNPVTQLNWCNNYANVRYGGWWAAQAHWASHGNW